ncbi:hypothetical protein [Odoribacter splanchnicus]|uniref:hypothetical protein n=1 Tax=Odoribacter splanchnicus TaxID=28118 RepID=UPI000B3B00AE|nr:hypothetical protein [Odoribacter splanchnicus]OUO16588.1 hypothetical protein B5F93_00520 [Odoribacter splanchnicus]
MKDQVLSISQMRHLRDLGVDTQEASIIHLFKDEEGYYIDYDKAEALREEIVVSDRYYDAKMEDCDHSLRMDYGVFTLQDLLNIIPSRILSESNEVFSLRIERCIDEWGIYYGTTEDSDGSKLSTPIYGDTLLESAYEMLCYLAENKLLERRGK